MSWSNAAIGDVVRFVRSSVTPEEIESGTRYVGLEHINGAGQFVNVGLVEAGELASSKFRFTRKHVLFGKLRPYLKKTARPHFEGVCSTDILPLEPTSRIDRDYLFHVLRRQSFVDEVSSLCAGANLPRISPKVLAGMQIPMPSIAEQRRIAAILDKADALRTKRREAIAKLDLLLQSVFLDMFGDPVANPKNWPKVALSELFEIARGGSPRPIDDYITDAPNGVNWIMIGDTSSGSKYITGTKKRIRPEGARRSREVKPGDFLLTNSMSFGRPYILRTAGCIHDGWLVLSPRSARTNADYLFSVLASPSLYAEFAGRAPGATVKNLNIDLVSGVEIPVPDSALQAEFSRKVSAIEAAQSSQQRALNRAEQLFLSIQAKAFSVGL